MSHLCGLPEWVVVEGTGFSRSSLLDIFLGGALAGIPHHQPISGKCTVSNSLNPFPQLHNLECFSSFSPLFALLAVQAQPDQ